MQVYTFTGVPVHGVHSVLVHAGPSRAVIQVGAHGDVPSHNIHAFHIQVPVKSPFSPVSKFHYIVLAHHCTCYDVARLHIF